MLIACHACGVGVDPDFVQPTPGKKCPSCGAPLDLTALEEFTNQDTERPGDPNDPKRAAVRNQMRADVLGFQSRHTAAAAAARAASPATVTG